MRGALRICAAANGYITTMEELLQDPRVDLEVSTRLGQTALFKAVAWRRRSGPRRWEHHQSSTSVWLTTLLIEGGQGTPGGVPSACLNDGQSAVIPVMPAPCCRIIFHSEISSCSALVWWLEGTPLVTWFVGDPLPTSPHQD